MKSIITKAVVAIAATVVVAGPSVANAYDQAEYTANGKPQFNTYTSVQNFGNEKDFFRAGPVGGRGSQFSNKFDVCDGEAQLNVYIHNGAPEGHNGDNYDGTGVAKDTKLNVQIPQGYGKNFNNTAVISASNAATVSDGATISCDGHEVKLEYIKGSAKITTGKRTNAPLSDAVVNGGTLVGYEANDGVVPGCWDYRLYVTLKVKVTKKPVEVPEQPEKPVTPVTTPPRELPRTGAGSVAGIVAATSVAGAAAHRVVTRRRDS